MTREERDNIRSRARKRLHSLLNEFENKCVWCGRILVLTRQFTGRLASVTAKVVTYIGPFGKVVTHCRATVDHLKPISEGGGNNRENLVPSCSNCNGKRSQPRHAHKFVERERIIREQRVKRGVYSLSENKGRQGNMNTSNFMVWIDNPRPAPTLADFLALVKTDNTLVFGKDD